MTHTHNYAVVPVILAMSVRLDRLDRWRSLDIKGTAIRARSSGGSGAADAKRYRGEFFSPSRVGIFPFHLTDVSHFDATLGGAKRGDDFFVRGGKKLPFGRDMLYFRFVKLENAGAVWRLDIKFTDGERG